MQLFTHCTALLTVLYNYFSFYCPSFIWHFFLTTMISSFNWSFFFPCTLSCGFTVPHRICTGTNSDNTFAVSWKMELHILTDLICFCCSWLNGILLGDTYPMLPSYIFSTLLPHTSCNVTTLSLFKFSHKTHWCHDTKNCHGSIHGWWTYVYCY